MKGDRLDRIRPRIESLLRCVRRCRDHWAEADDKARRSLWQRMHLAAAEMDDSLMLMDDERKHRPGEPDSGGGA